MPIPLLILSDAPSGSTGLGRICRELALRIHGDMADTFRVATLGIGGKYSVELPFPQYEIKEVLGYVPINLPQVWRNFARGEKGIVLTIWNPGWLPAFANPELLPDGPLKNFLREELFQKWGYFPVDGHSVGARLPKEAAEVFAGFDRVLAYTKYGADVIEKTIGQLVPEIVGASDDNPHRLTDNVARNLGAQVPYLPHGLDTSVFYPRNNKEARDTFVDRVAGLGPAPLLEDVFMVGIVATNTARKDWYLAFEVCSELKKRGKSVGIWAHTDKMQGAWNIPMLAREFELDSVTVASNRLLDDEDMAWAYSAMDITLGIGSGEGWGYPLAESLACGVPVIHGDYAGGAEIVPQRMLVSAKLFRGDGQFGILRPVFYADRWAVTAMRYFAGEAVLPPHIDWNNAWLEWKKWLASGI